MSVCQHMHAQNHAYANKSRHMYVHDIHQLLNPTCYYDFSYKE